MSYNYLDSLTNESRSRYLHKLKTIDLKECPYRLPADAWLNDLSQWPNIEYPDIYDYLINTPGAYSKEAMKARKSLEAYNQYQSGWVQTIRFYKVNAIIILSAKVMHSQLINEEPLWPWVASSKNGSIICAHCNCMAGLGESCSHIGALLFKIEAAVRLGYTTIACTSQPCQWNNDFVKKIKGVPLHDVSLYKKGGLDPSPVQDSNELTKGEQESFMTKLLSLDAKEQPVALSLFSKFSGAFHNQATCTQAPRLPKCLRTFFTRDIQKIEEKRKELYSQRISKEDIAYIEQSTRHQSKSLVWQEVRIGRITASIAHDVLHTSITRPAVSLVLKICNKSPPLKVQALTWGVENEEKALGAYEEKLKADHRGLVLSTPGLLLSETHPFMGASADGIGQCECHGKFLVEIKCPFKHREAKTIQECIIDEHFCLDKNSELKKNHKYYSQVQMQMSIYDIKVCHLVIWTKHFCKGILVSYNADFQDSMERMIDFHEKVISYELVTRKLEHGKQKAVQTNSEAEIFCYCQQPGEEEDMIGCDNLLFKYKWVHFRCITPCLKRAPKGAWYCKDYKKVKRSRKSKNDDNDINFKQFL